MSRDQNARCKEGRCIQAPSGRSIPGFRRGVQERQKTRTGTASMKGEVARVNVYLCIKQALFIRPMNMHCLVPVARCRVQTRRYHCLINHTQSRWQPLPTPCSAAKLPRARSRSSLRMVNAPLLSTQPPHFHIRRRFALIYANFFLPLLKPSKLVKTSSLRRFFVSTFRFAKKKKKGKEIVRIWSTDSSSRERARHRHGQLQQISDGGERDTEGRGRENETTVKSRQMVIRGHRGDDIQNVNRTNQSDLVGRKTDPRTFEDCTRGMCAPATPKIFHPWNGRLICCFAHGFWSGELRFGDEEVGGGGHPSPSNPTLSARGRAWYILLNMDRRIIVAAISRGQMHRLCGGIAVWID